MMRTGGKTVASLLGTGGTAVTQQTATVNIDRLGFNWADISVVLGTAAATTNKPTVLKLGESDITDATGFADIVAFTGGTQLSSTVGFVFNAADTQNANVYRFRFDCRYRKRYLKLSVTPVTAQEMVVVSHLGSGAWSETGFITAAAAGANTLVEG